nr:ribokinase [Rhodococcus sp. (in: high G+C Gram-positive bacteria)]
MTTTRVTVLGSINMDLVTGAAALPSPGETVLGNSFATAQGGKGANQAIAAAKSGARTTFIGSVGDDAFADELATCLSAAEVDTTLLRREPGPSGIAAITVDQAGENSIVVVPGANSSVTDLTDTELSAIADADILLCQLEIPLATVIAGAAHAREHSTVVMLNPSPVQPLPDSLVDTVDVLVVNEAEAAAIGPETLDRIDHVVITLGSAGARYRALDTTFDVSAPKVEAVDTTGAGDAFAGALASEWHAGPSRAMAFACAGGAFATTGRGAGSSSGSRADIEALLA